LLEVLEELQLLDFLFQVCDRPFDFVLLNYRIETTGLQSHVQAPATRSCHTYLISRGEFSGMKDWTILIVNGTNVLWSD
jgi:hypothetical protein